MLTKMKIALVLCGSLLGGVAAAQPAAGSAAPDRKAEFKAEREAKKQELLQKFDTNKDGKLDKTERAAMKDELVLERFKKLDTDGNGVLSLAEFKAGQVQHRHMRHARGRAMGQLRHRGRPRGMGTTSVK